MGKVVNLPQSSIKRSVDFAHKIVGTNAQSKRDFQSKLERSEIDAIADTVKGKLAELGFAEFAKWSAGLIINPDFEIYSDTLQIDFGQDVDEVMIGGKNARCRSKIDVKATRSSSQWLLVEQGKFWSDAYVLVKVLVPSDAEKNLKWLGSKSITATIEGFAYHFDLIDQKTKSPWFKFKQGTQLFSTKVLDNLPTKTFWDAHTLRDWLRKMNKEEKIRSIGPWLKAKWNYGLPIKWLRNSDDEWNSFFQWIEKSTIDANNYRVYDFLPTGGAEI